jgi:hypothetical protein
MRILSVNSPLSILYRENSAEAKKVANPFDTRDFTQKIKKSESEV